MGPWQSAWWVEASPNSPNLRARISVHSLELVTRLKAGQSFYTNSRWFCESGRVIFFRWCIYQYLSHNLLWICFSLMFVSVLVSPLRRGKGKGFQDPVAKPLFAGIKTLRLTKPKLWVFECVEAMAARSTESTGTALTDGKKAQHDLEASAISLWFAT